MEDVTLHGRQPILIGKLSDEKHKGFLWKYLSSMQIPAIHTRKMFMGWFLILSDNTFSESQKKRNSRGRLIRAPCCAQVAEWAV